MFTRYSNGFCSFGIKQPYHVIYLFFAWTKPKSVRRNAYLIRLFDEIDVVGKRLPDFLVGLTAFSLVTGSFYILIVVLSRELMVFSLLNIFFQGPWTLTTSKLIFSNNALSQIGR